MRPKRHAQRAGHDKKPAPRIRALIPLTLIDASSNANIARDLAVYAAAIRAYEPCHAHITMLFAQQIADSYTTAQAVTNYTDVPQATGAPAGTTITDLSLSDTAHDDSPPQQPPGP